MEGRKAKATRNIIFGLIGQVITMVLSFVSRTVFLYCFTKEYVGISSLFSGIFSFLTLADLGMEASMTVRLYKPLAEQDWSLLKTLLRYYRRIYNIIASVIFIAGLILLPFLNLFVDIPSGIQNVELIYVLMLLKTCVTYLFIYRKIVFIADQKKYVTDIVQYCVTVIQYVVLIPLLLLTREYVIYLVVQCGFQLIYNAVIMILGKRKYTQVYEAKEALFDTNLRKEIRGDMTAISLHRIGDVVSTHSWTILVSSCINVVVAGMYSNYQLLIGYVKVFMDKVFYAISPSVGNMIVTEGEKKIYNFFNKMLFASFFLTVLCGNCLLCLLNPFIRMWLTDSFLLPQTAVIVTIISFYLTNMRKPVLIFKEAYGFFKNDRYRPLVESGINIAISLGLCKILGLGLEGILLGPVLSYLISAFWIEPYILFKNGFHMDLKLYFKRYLVYVAFTVVVFSVSATICSSIKPDITGFFLSGVICVLASVGSVVVVFRRTDEFRWFADIVFRMVKRYLNQKHGMRRI